MTIHRNTYTDASGRTVLRISTSLYQDEQGYVLEQARKMAAKRNLPVEIRSNRYDGFGRIAEKGCFWEDTILPDGTSEWQIMRNRAAIKE